MNKFIAAVVLTISLTVPLHAIACTILQTGDLHSPEDVQAFEYMLKSNSLVVLARPLEINRVPVSVQGPYLSLRDPFELTVKWEVLYSWKGSQPNDTFWTTRTIEPATDPCAGWSMIPGYAARFLYASGASPFTKYYSVEVAGAGRDLMYLQETFNPGTGR